MRQMSLVSVQITPRLKAAWTLGAQAVWEHKGLLVRVVLLQAGDEPLCV